MPIKTLLRWLLLEGNSLIEYHKFPRNNVLSVGDIYLSKVKKPVPSLNAAFVNINADKEALLALY